MILITGATGMVGSCLAMHLLETEKGVIALFRSEKSKEKTKSYFELYQKTELFEKIIWEECDVLDIASLEYLFQKYHFEAIYHCAACISFDPKDFEIMIKTNVEGTANMVNFALTGNVRNFCHVSSIAALGESKKKDAVIDETLDWNKEKYHNDYAISKNGAEIEVWRGFQEGLPAVIVNPGVILGAGFWETGSGAIFNQVLDSKNFYTNGFTGFVAVEDLVKIMISLVEKNIKGENYIVISENICYKKINEWITSSIPKYHVKPFVTNVLYRLDWLFSKLFFTKRKITKSLHLSLHSISIYSNEKVVATLNYEFEKVENTIKRIMLLKKGN